MTKTEKAVALWKEGEVKKALAIFVTFKIGFSKAEQRTLQIANECLAGHVGFYSQLGIDIKQELKKAREIINTRYL